MKPARLLVLAAVAALVAAWFAFDLGRYLSLDALKAQREVILAWRDAQPLTASLAFVAIYVAVTALSLPGAAILTLAAGAIFGLGWGLVLASFASSIGATLAMLVARFVAGEAVQRRYAERLRAINAGIERDGAFYLFTLRLVPLFPFFVINLLMGLTRIRVWTFYWISQIGMLAGTAVYVNAGTQLAHLESVGGIFSPGLLGAFVLLGLFPLIARRLVDLVRARRVYAPYRRPRHFDRNLIVIGAGSAGLVSALIAATVRARVTLIERHRMGGDCLNTGCVPSKALIRSAKLAAQMRRAEEFGLAPVDARPVFAQVMERVQEVVRAIEPHDSIERYTGLGVECIKGRARLVDPWTVDVDGRRRTARDIVIATGAEPLVPPIPGLREAGYRTSEDLWDLRELPARLVVLGGGPIGCELAQAFARLGSKVTQVEMLPRLMMREDPEISATVQARFAAEGIDVRVGTRATSVVIENGQKWLVCEADDGPLRVGFDEILVAVGRVSRLGGYGLEELGVRTGRTLEVNEYLQTSFPNIWACGDVAGPYQFTHTASHMAWYAAVNSLFGPLLALRGGRFRVDYRVIPWATFTEPEVATAGLTEPEAKEKGLDYKVGKVPFAAIGKAIANNATDGFVKVLIDSETKLVLGVTIVGHHASDLISEAALAIEMSAEALDVGLTIHPHPTLGEGVMEAAKAALGEAIHVVNR